MNSLLLLQRWSTSSRLGFQYWNNLIDSTTRAPLVTFPERQQFGTNTNVPQNSIQSKYQFKDDMTKTIGKHTFKTGVDYIWTPVDGWFLRIQPDPGNRFRENPSCILGVAPATTAIAVRRFSARLCHAGAVNGMTIGSG